MKLSFHVVVLFWLFQFLICISANRMHRFRPIAFNKRPNLSFSQQHSEADRRQAPKLFRTIRFWKDVLHIFFSYKLHQARLRLRNIFLRVINREGKGELDAERDRRDWHNLHEKNSKRLLKICLSLRGFYLKTGQFLATRHDFMPIEYTSVLATLQDNVPSMCEDEVRLIIERELQLLQDRGHLLTGNFTNLAETSLIDFYFESLDLAKPVGSASIAQVHRGNLKTRYLDNSPAKLCGKSSNETIDVAVKVQNSEAFVLMMQDLSNLRWLARWLRNSGELNFDVYSAVQELSQQVHYEFDFQREAQHLSYFGQLFQRRKKKFRSLVINVPTPILSTQKLLVMSFLPGKSLIEFAQRDAGSGRGNVDTPLWMQKQFFQGLLYSLGDVWATMMFTVRPASNLHPPSPYSKLRSLTNKYRVSPIWHSNADEAEKIALDEEMQDPTEDGDDMEAGVFHADPHPGNIFLHLPANTRDRTFPAWFSGTAVASIGILDWGQVKRLHPHRLKLLAKLFVVIKRYHQQRRQFAVSSLALVDSETALVQAFLNLGIVVAKPEDHASVVKIALTVFDTMQSAESQVANPFAPGSPIRANPVHHLPSDLFFVMRTIQILRGLVFALDKKYKGLGNWSLAEQWAPFAESYLNRS